MSGLRVCDMYPPRNLQPFELLAYSKLGAIVTIESLATNHWGEWFMQTREIRNRIKLTPYSAANIARSLDTEFKDKWIGQVIRIVAAEFEGRDRETGEPFTGWTIDVLPIRPSGLPVLPLLTDFHGLADDPARAAILPGADERVLDMTPIGRDVAIELLGDVMERGIQCSVVAKSIGSAYPELGELHPLMLNTWPAAALEPTRRFIRSFPRCQSRLSRERIEREIGSTWDTPAETTC